jgi:hypothetical protein
MNRINILLFSPQNQQSMFFYKMVQKEGLEGFFQIINKDLKPLPQYQNVLVPAIIINQANGTSFLHQGPEAFQWLQRFKQYKQTAFLNYIGGMSTQQISNMAGNLGVNLKSIEYSPLEMSGISDAFTYLADQMIPHNFVDPTVQIDIITPPDPRKKEKMGEVQHKKKADQLLRERKEFNEKYKRGLDQFHESLSKKR